MGVIGTNHVRLDVHINRRGEGEPDGADGLADEGFAVIVAGGVKDIRRLGEREGGDGHGVGDVVVGWRRDSSGGRVARQDTRRAHEYHYEPEDTTYWN
jgi:hypothetical protein